MIFFFLQFLLIAISLLKTNTQHPANMNIIETYLNMYTEACTLKQVAYKLKKIVYMLKIVFCWNISTEKSTHLSMKPVSSFLNRERDTSVKKKAQKDPSVYYFFFNIQKNTSVSLNDTSVFKKTVLSDILHRCQAKGHICLPKDTSFL